LPLLIPLAVWSGASLARPRLWRPVPILALTGVLAVLVFWPTSDHEGAAFLCDVGSVLAKQGRFEQARRNFREALRISPDDPRALNGIALSYMDQGDPDKAAALLREIIRDHPDFTLARRNLRAILDYRDRKR